MADEVTTPQGSESPEQPPPNAAAEATDFREYVKWRKTGDPPAEPEAAPQPAAAEPPKEEPQAKTEPQSGADDSTQETEEEEQPKRGGSRQRRIDKLTLENEQLKAQLAAATSQKPPEPPKPPPDPGEPKLENYDSLEAWQKAWNRWDRAQMDKEREEAEQKRELQKRTEKLDAEWASKQTKARKAHPDYDDVIDGIAAPDGPGVLAARQAMLEDEAGAEILYHLAKHPDEIKRIAAMTPIAAVREIGRLSAILTPTPPANGKRITDAPKPPPGATRPARMISDSIFDPAVQADYKRYARARAAMKD